MKKQSKASRQVKVKRQKIEREKDREGESEAVIVGYGVYSHLFYMGIYREWREIHRERSEESPERPCPLPQEKSIPVGLQSNQSRLPTKLQSLHTDRPRSTKKMLNIKK